MLQKILNIDLNIEYDVVIYIIAYNELTFPCSLVSDWDLGVCLMYECKRKQLLKPAQLNSWIDLRATYRVTSCIDRLGITKSRYHLV